MGLDCLLGFVLGSALLGALNDRLGGITGFHIGMSIDTISCESEVLRIKSVRLAARTVVDVVDVVE